jgi:hypothetical protein
VANRLMRLGLFLLGGFTFAVLLQCSVQSASAHETDVHQRSVDSHAPALGAATAEAKPASRSTRRPVSAKGPYYVDFRARTRAVNVAGLTPAGDTLEYMLGYVTWVPSETGASYGDLDPEYLTADYRVYLNARDAKKVFAYIKQLQANSPVWNAEFSNCTSFIGSIASYMGLKTPVRWTRPEEYVKRLKEMNDGRQFVQLNSDQ